MVLQKLGIRRLWGPVSTLAVLQPYANPRNNFPGNFLKDICIFLYHYNLFDTFTHYKLNSRY